MQITSFIDLPYPLSHFPYLKILCTLLRFRWRTPGTIMSTTTTTRAIHHHYPRWSKCWSHRRRCCRLCNKTWWPCSMPKETSLHHSPSHETSWASSRGLSLPPSCILWSPWVRMTGWRRLRKSSKLCSVVTGRVCYVCLPTSEWWHAYVNAPEEPESINW
jgi:hypothetical protein